MLLNYDTYLCDSSKTFAEKENFDIELLAKYYGIKRMNLLMKW